MTKLQGLSLQKLGSVRRRGVQVGHRDLVQMRPLFDDGDLPLLIEPAEGDISLASWGAQNRELIDAKLDHHAGILFRGFGVASTQELQEAIRSSCGDLLEYSDRVQPRSQVDKNVYTSTLYPPDQSIEMHNESSYAFTWALRISFLCLQPALEGGATPVADCRRLLRAIDPEVRARFLEKKVMYVRNFGDGFGITWQEAFGTEDREEMEAFCRRTGVEVEWKEGGRLRTRSVRPAVLTHPRTGDEVWFNAAVSSHISTIESSVREALLQEFAPEDMPKNSFYGDGSEIEAEALAEIRRAYRETSIQFPWQKGDVLLLDNMLAAHGRTPYSGPRKVVVGMARPVSVTDCAG